MRKWNNLTEDEREDRFCYVLGGVSVSSLMVLMSMGVI